MAPAYVIGSWMALAGHVLASAGHHHHQHLHHQRDAIIHTLPIPSEVVEAAQAVDDFARGPATTAAPSLGDSCGQVNAAIVSCADIIPHFDKADKQQIGQCLCCSGKAYHPKLFENKAAQCASYIKSLAPTSTDAINQWAALENFCEPNGPVGNIAGLCTKSFSYNKPKTSSAAPMTIANVGAPMTAAAAPAIAPACVSIEAIGNSCMQATPGFGKLTPKSQAECYCYSKSTSTTAWIPDRLGGYASKCADWAEHASQTSLASVASDLVDLCSGYGDFLAETTATNVAIAAMPTLLGSDGPSAAAAHAMITSDAATPAATGASAGESTPTAAVPTSSAMTKQVPAALILAVSAVMWLL